MDIASTRKTAMRIHSSLLNKISVMGQRRFAEAMGVHESQVSRWKNGMLETMSMALAILNYGVEDEDLARLAKQVARVLTKKKSPAATRDSVQQFSIDF
ncbi:Phage transcriptional activator CII [Sodalis praecaptivus]|uniref:Phage transcriptional activator CII n=1 Tax=Sodalis praecaptivus TaxID=1239307 RepID=W0HZL6_9GAMM|nr:CII family transcriptional regulator [Sodalis praecaptivus]AHF77932.1 Phage transcriptional activator CII [Sodalis praecaptivus]